MEEMLFNKLYEELRLNKVACEDGDIESSHFTAGRFMGYCDVLELMGHEVRCFYRLDDTGCKNIMRLNVDGVEHILKDKRVFCNV